MLLLDSISTLPFSDSTDIDPFMISTIFFVMAIPRPVLPYLLSFAAGAMFYVVVEEFIPEMSEGSHSNVGTICFAFGFVMMMALDVGLG